MKIVYLSGKITGLEQSVYEQKFKNRESRTQIMKIL